MSNMSNVQKMKEFLEENPGKYISGLQRICNSCKKEISIEQKTCCGMQCELRIESITKERWMVLQLWNSNIIIN